MGDIKQFVIDNLMLKRQWKEVLDYFPKNKSISVLFVFFKI